MMTGSVSQTDKGKEQSSLRRLLGNMNFNCLFAGVTTSQLGDQFALVAIPWLVLQLTGDPFILGLVLALEGVPRAALMLVGGVVTDRFSPRLVLLVSDLVRLVLAGLMAVAVFAGVVEIWMLFAFSLGFGIVSGFAVPAGNAIVPMVVAEQDLQSGNSLVMGSGQVAGFVGPVLAGILIGSFSHSLAGVGYALGIDALTFAFSALMMGLMGAAGHGAGDHGPDEEGMLEAIGAGLQYMKNDSVLRFLFLIIAGVNLLFVGPLLVGIPVLADQRLAEGATAFGMLMSGFSGGNLAGYVLAATLPRPRGRVMRWLVLVLLSGFGLVLISLGFVNRTLLNLILLAVLGGGNGFITIILFTSIQKRTPKAMLGRMMSLIMLASLGLVPVSQALAGALSNWSLTAMFVVAGVLLFGAAAWAARQDALGEFSEEIWRMEETETPTESTAS